MERIDPQHLERLTLDNGAPRPATNESLLACQGGPALLADVSYVEQVAHFDREKTVERVVHAKGAAAFGSFKVTNGDVYKKYCAADFLSASGKKTPIAIRFSTVIGQSGSQDTIREHRGFAVKFYTSEGNFDLVGINFPVFFLRDPIKFPAFVHSQTRNPQSNLHDPNAYWDFLSLNPETMHLISMIYSERGIPDGYRHMHGFGVNTFKLINKKLEVSYAKFHLKCEQKIRNLEGHKAVESLQEPDYAIRDLFKAIENGKYPSWILKIQVIKAEDLKNAPIDPFDPTKTWPYKKYPLIEVGRLTLDKNPENYFAQVEQLAFSPANLVPGIQGAYQDKLFAGRAFSYPDTQRYRLGVNNQRSIDVNKAINFVATPTYQFGSCMSSVKNSPQTPTYIPSNYYPNLISPKSLEEEYKVDAMNETPLDIKGTINRYPSGDGDNFSQVKIFYDKVLSDESRKKLAENLADSLKLVSEKKIVEAIYKQLAEINEQLAKTTKKLVKRKQCS